MCCLTTILRHIPSINFKKQSKKGESIFTKDLQKKTFPDYNPNKEYDLKDFSKVQRFDNQTGREKVFDKTQIGGFRFFDIDQLMNKTKS